MKVPEDSREKVKNLLKDANENGVKISHQAPTLYDVVPKEEIAEFEELMRKTIVLFGKLNDVPSGRLFRSDLGFL